MINGEWRHEDGGAGEGDDAYTIVRKSCKNFYGKGSGRCYTVWGAVFYSHGAGGINGDEDIPRADLLCGGALSFMGASEGDGHERAAEEAKGEGYPAAGARRGFY